MTGEEGERAEALTIADVRIAVAVENAREIEEIGREIEVPRDILVVTMTPTLRGPAPVIATTVAATTPRLASVVAARVPRAWAMRRAAPNPPPVQPRPQ